MEASDQVVCALPEGFELTEAKYGRIVEAWRARGRVMLDADDVLELFRTGLESRTA